MSASICSVVDVVVLVVEIWVVPRTGGVTEAVLELVVVADDGAVDAPAVLAAGSVLDPVEAAVEVTGG